MAYNVESYWDRVAGQIELRDRSNLIAGDDEPFYKYKRKLFVRLFDTIDFKHKKVMEIGCGPGGNLLLLTGKECKKITGVDISASMLELAARNLKNSDVELKKIDGITLPFPNGSYDLVFTSTVLQHNTDEIKLRQLIREIGRVAEKEIIIFERIEKKIKGNDTNTGRPVDFYQKLFAENRFTLTNTRFIQIQASHFIMGGIRKLFNKKDRDEGAPVSRSSRILQRFFLPLTKLADRIIPSRRDLAMLHFKRE
jgi:ubiquinone/menaquinone biosynthesis C-methylase UbiE